MSECVVRMERVPKNCDDGCWGSLSGECPWCDSIDGYKMVGNRPPNCPIIAVLPENHGRLVDADVLLEQHRESVFTKVTDFTEGQRSVVANIKNAPTIVPADTAERSEK